MHIFSNNPYLSGLNWECVKWRNSNRSHALMPCKNQGLCTAATKAFNKAAIACTSTDVGGSDTLWGILSWLTQRLHKAHNVACVRIWSLQGCTGIHSDVESSTWYARMSGVVVQVTVHKRKSVQTCLLWCSGQDASLLATCTTTMSASVGHLLTQMKTKSQASCWQVAFMVQYCCCASMKQTHDIFLGSQEWGKLEHVFWEQLCTNPHVAQHYGQRWGFVCKGPSMHLNKRQGNVY